MSYSAAIKGFAEIREQRELSAAEIEEIQRLDAQRRVYMDGLGVKIMEKIDEAIAWRRPFEQRWIDAKDQKEEGYTTVSEARQQTGGQAQVDNHNSCPDNITYEKTTTISARLQDMCFPTQEKNWDLEPSKRPTLAPLVQKVRLAMVQQTQPVTQPMMGMPQAPGMAPPPDAAAAKADLQKEAARRADIMESIVADRLEESEYSLQGRRMIDEGVLLGTGVMEGPFLRSVLHEVWDPGNNSFYSEYVLVPAVEQFSIWEFFPQPSRSMKECSYAARLHTMKVSEVEKLIGQPGFDEEQIRRLIDMKPDLGTMSGNPMLLRNGAGYDVAATLKDRYMVWKFVGDIDKECLDYFGITIEGEVSTLSGEIWICQGVVIKVALRPLVTSDRLPFYTWCYDRDEGAIFGWGVPHRMRHDQTAANITWSAALFKAQRSAGEIIGVVKKYLENPDGSINLKFDRPQHLLLDGVDDIRKAISQFVLDGDISSILEMYDRTTENADKHTMLPPIAQGEATKAMQTSSGFALALNQSNIIQRRAAKSLDDDVTVPLVRAMVRYEMIEGDNADAKGDFDVIPKASSHLVVKDLRIQHNMTLLALSDNPQNAIYFNREELIRQIVSDLDMPSDKVLNSPEKVLQLQQQQAEQPNPEMMKIELEKAKLDADNYHKDQDRQTKMLMEQNKLRTEIIVASINRDAEMAKAASNERVSLQDLAATLQMHTGKQQLDKYMAEIDANNKLLDSLRRDSTQRFKLGIDAETKAAEIADRKESRQTQLRVETPVRIAQ